MGVGDTEVRDSVCDMMVDPHQLSINYEAPRFAWLNPMSVGERSSMLELFQI